MHTTTKIHSADFELSACGRPASLEHIFPGFNRLDRIGFVVRQPGGGIGASALLMAAMAKFYDFYREQLGNKPGRLRIYPEFYIFHVGDRYMDHYWMDIWPSHKEVDVADEAEQILEAINDRGITRLLVPDAAPVNTVALYERAAAETLDPSSATFLAETVSSAETRILSALAYSATGRTKNADIQIGSCPEAENCVLASINSSHKLTDSEREQLRTSRQFLYTDGRVTETYRRIPLSDALGMLTPCTRLSETTLNYMLNM
ncbi:hypothetical protein [Paenibacillus beijingensis]|uniref:Uncharacterized protein n=1 Tax=Paenibacillus beijingensis TaxID=1126833 RepID=A0A0D5NE86_9BACL|nr:hypothetical protein [Paenibacillus beijingensis]AJY73475.1 hypothetical protein VN24_01100 [Paenibacillus beijingensis]